MFGRKISALMLLAVFVAAGCGNGSDGGTPVVGAAGEDGNPDVPNNPGDSSDDPLIPGAYQDPERSYENPDRSYDEPAGTYEDPARSYENPDRSYQPPPGSPQAPQPPDDDDDGGGEVRPCDPDSGCLGCQDVCEECLCQFDDDEDSCILLALCAPE